MESALWKFIIMTQLPVVHSYRYQDKFQLLPPPDNALMPSAALNDYPCILEFTFTKPTHKVEIPGGGYFPQEIVESDAAAKAKKEIILLLTAITTNRFFSYGSHQSWFITLDEGKVGEPSQWGQELYSSPGIDLGGEEFSNSTPEPIAKIEPNKYYNRYGRTFDQVLDLPENIDALLDKYYALDDVSREYFLSSCSLFSQGLKLWSEHPSISFAAIVSALEALIHIDHINDKHEVCGECNQPRYRVVHKFKEFFSKYGTPDEGFKKYALKIYKYRSKILHRGELFLGDVRPRGFCEFSDLEDDNIRRSIITTCRICITNWLFLSGQN